MTRKSGGGATDPGPGAEPKREPAGNAREKGEDPSTDDRGRSETSDAEDCTAHDRAS